MTKVDFLMLMPLFILSSVAILIQFSTAIKRNHRFNFIIAAVIIVADLIYLIATYEPGVHVIEPLLIFDGLGNFSIGLFLATTLFVVLMSFAYFEQREERKEEYYILLVLGTLGSSIMVISKHFASMFLGLEILSVSLYAMVSYLRKRERSDEAGIKYLLLAAFSSAFLLFGMALVYTVCGTMEFGGIATKIAEMESMPVMLLAGFGLMIVGVGFKLGVAPFHMWTADVYEGAPVPVTAFIATVSKGGMIILLVRFFTQVDGYRFDVLLNMFAVLAIASMLIGNLLALQQDNLKRILAYSSIAHMGYVMVAFLAGGSFGIEAVIFYLITYFITSLGAFGIIAMLSDEDRDAEKVEDYKGLFWRKPWTAAILTAILLSLAGIPLTAGFVGKFYVVAAGVEQNLWIIAGVLVISSVIGLFYYIRVIAAMFEKEGGREVLRAKILLVSGVTISILAVLVLWLGVAPGQVINLIRYCLSQGPD